MREELSSLKMGNIGKTYLSPLVYIKFTGVTHVTCGDGETSHGDLHFASIFEQFSASQNCEHFRRIHQNAQICKRLRYAIIGKRRQASMHKNGVGENIDFKYAPLKNSSLSAISDLSRQTDWLSCEFQLNAERDRLVAQV